MEVVKSIEIIGTRAFFRPSGPLSAGQLADLITVALREARDHAVQDIVVNIAAVTGFESPGPAYRRWVARRWAEALGSRIHLAVVARPEHICPQKTGLLVAAEEGLRAHICNTEADALSWLDAQEAYA